MGACPLTSRSSGGRWHLGVLVAAGLVRVEPHGRQRRYRLADVTVAAALEQLGHLCPTTEVASLRHSREQRDLARARLCYDHLAGRLGVGITDSFLTRGSPYDEGATGKGDEG